MIELQKADLHKMTAAVVFRKPIEEVTRDDRQMANAVSFGFLYGQSAGYSEFLACR
jgi:DNA polymerase I-like protein with 3'-5' exonuclease and polymerase domains